MAIYVILFSILGVLSSVVGIFHRQASLRRDRRRRAAAEILIKHGQLEKGLLMQQAGAVEKIRQILVLTIESPTRDEYVLDPSRGVQVGRDVEKSQICIFQDEVSQAHCLLYQYGNDICICDQGSKNGTFIKQGPFVHRVHGTAYLHDGDLLCIGGARLRVHSFWMDTTYL